MPVLIGVGAVCVSVGQCAAGVCKTFGPFLVCQGVIFGIGEHGVVAPYYQLKQITMDWNSADTPQDSAW